MAKNRRFRPTHHYPSAGPQDPSACTPQSTHQTTAGSPLFRSSRTCPQWQRPGASATNPPTRPNPNPPPLPKATAQGPVVLTIIVVAPVNPAAFRLLFILRFWLRLRPGHVATNRARVSALGPVPGHPQHHHRLTGFCARTAAAAWPRA